jgi:hypothetical protein
MKQKRFDPTEDHNRSFGGKISGFESRDEAMREKKHLKSYLKGKKTYRHGFETVELNDDSLHEALPGFSFRRPKIYEVKEIWTPKNKQ